MANTPPVTSVVFDKKGTQKQLHITDINQMRNTTRLPRRSVVFILVPFTEKNQMDQQGKSHLLCRERSHDIIRKIIELFFLEQLAAFLLQIYPGMLTAGSVFCDGEGGINFLSDRTSDRNSETTAGKLSERRIQGCVGLFIFGPQKKLFSLLFFPGVKKSPTPNQIRSKILPMWGLGGPSASPSILR